MNVVSFWPLLATLAGFVVFTAGIAIAVGYFGRPNLRQRFPGGPRRYLAALTVQGLGFVTPMPIVWIYLLGVPPQGLNFVAAIVAGIIVLVLLRFLPWTGPLLTDLAKTRQQADQTPR